MGVFQIGGRDILQPVARPENCISVTVAASGLRSTVRLGFGVAEGIYYEKLKIAPCAGLRQKAGLKAANKGRNDTHYGRIDY
jgi:hypothetical protein